MTRAAAIVAVVFVLAACGGGGASGRTTVEHYANFPSDTIAVSASAPMSAACRRDALAFARESTSFLAAHHNSLTTVDALYFTLREAAADFEARRCEPKLLGESLAGALSPARRRELLADLPRSMAAMLRGALAAAGA